MHSSTRPSAWPCPMRSRRPGDRRHLRSETVSGRVLGRFYRSGSIDSAELLEAARTEQGFVSPEGHAALYCLIGWVHIRVHHLQPR